MKKFSRIMIEKLITDDELLKMIGSNGYINEKIKR
jgi:hypothetical protein